MAVDKIIAGLGNPDRQYAKNRHNIGFMLADRLFADYGSGEWQSKANGLTATININDESVLLVKPQTYMNLSGEVIGKLMRFYKLPLEALWVLHDELDLPFGKLQVKFAGGTAGHNGLKNIAHHIGLDFHRLRFGIGHPGSKGAVSDYVLHDFDDDETNEVEELIISVSKNIGKILAGEKWN